MYPNKAGIMLRLFLLRDQINKFMVHKGTHFLVKYVIKHTLFILTLAICCWYIKTIKHTLFILTLAICCWYIKTIKQISLVPLTEKKFVKPGIKLYQFTIQIPTWMFISTIQIPTWMFSSTIQIPTWMFLSTIQIPTWMFSSTIQIPTWMFSSTIQIPTWMFSSLGECVKVLSGSL